MAPIKRILFFGFSGINDVQITEGKIEFAGNDSAEHFSNYDIIIYQSGSFGYRYQRTQVWGTHRKDAPPEAVRREKEIQNALEKGKIVCFIGSDADDYVIMGVLKSNKIYVNYIDSKQICSNIAVKRSEFKSFIDDLGASKIWFPKEDVDQVIASAYESTVVGFSKKVGKGTLLFIPCMWGSTKLDYVVEHTKKLVSALISFSAKIVSIAPDYVEEYEIADERSVKDKIEKIRNDEIAPLENRLAYYRKMKAILWLGDRSLVTASENFLKNIGLQVEIDEIFEEDLWIVNQKRKLVIVEVKGLNKNLTRQDISKLDEHREARLEPNLTGLLIVNTFMTASSLENKTIPFPPNVVQKAVNSSILITRTIDLCKMLNVLEKNENSSRIFLDAIIGKRDG
jgi:hypothetical protein